MAFANNDVDDNDNDDALNVLCDFFKSNMYAQYCSHILPIIYMFNLRKLCFLYE